MVDMFIYNDSANRWIHVVRRSSVRGMQETPRGLKEVMLSSIYDLSPGKDTPDHNTYLAGFFLAMAVEVRRKS